MLDGQQSQSPENASNDLNSDVHPVQITVAKEACTASKYGPGSFPAALWGGIKRGLVDRWSAGVR